VISPRQDQAAPDDVFQLSHVSGEVVAHEQIHGLARNGLFRSTGLVRVFGQEVFGQQGDVGTPAPERRNLDGDHGQPVVEIFTESSGLHLGHQVAVRGRDEPHVHGARDVGADALHDPVLQHTQQLDLDLFRQVADLVQEQAAAGCDLEAPLPGAVGAGEGAALVAEQLAFE